MEGCGPMCRKPFKHANPFTPLPRDSRYPRRRLPFDAWSHLMAALLVVLFLFLAVVGYLIGTYNGLVQVRAAVKLAWSNIDVLLVQRHDELPKLVEVCKQYMQYEGGTLERVIRARAGVDAARSSGNIASLGAAEGELRAGLTRLYAVAENYPELKRTSRSVICRSASAASRPRSPTAARYTTTRSIPTMSASRASRACWSRAWAISQRRDFYSSRRTRRRTLT